MVDRINPINSFNNEVAQTSLNASTPAPSPTVEDTLQAKLDVPRPSSTAYTRRLNELLSNARTSLGAGRLDQAESYYKQYIDSVVNLFKLFPQLRTLTVELPRDFHSARLELARTLGFSRQRDAAREILNTALAQTVQPVLTEDRPEFQPIQDYIVQLQDQGLFPTNERVNVDIPPEALDRLADQSREINQPELAQFFEGERLAREFIDNPRPEGVTIERPANQLVQQSTVQNMGRPVTLPVAPYLPAVPEATQRLQSMENSSSYETGVYEAQSFKTESIEPLRKGTDKDPGDPDPRDEKRRTNITRKASRGRSGPVSSDVDAYESATLDKLEGAPEEKVQPPSKKPGRRGSRSKKGRMTI